MNQTSALEFTIPLIRQCIIDLLVHPANGFERREYLAVCNLLWSIENFPHIKGNYIRLGIGSNDPDCQIETVIRYEGDYMVVSEEGIERTPRGSDSFERNYNQISASDYTNEEPLDFNFDSFQNWFTAWHENLDDNMLVTIESSKPDFFFSKNLGHK